MKNLVPLTALALAASALLTATPALAKGSFLKVEMTIDVVFEATPSTPPGASGDATVEVKYDSTKKGVKKQKAKGQLDVEGLPAGTYTAEAKLANGSVASLGSFNSEAGDEEDFDFEAKLPASVDARNIVEIIIKNSVGVAVFAGEGINTIAKQIYSGRARVTLVGGSRAGSVRVFSEIEDDEELDREVDFSASGAPPSQTLNILADGEEAGVVESDEEGNVEFTEDEFDEFIDLAFVREITITDAAGAVVMRATF